MKTYIYEIIWATAEKRGHAVAVANCKNQIIQHLRDSGLPIIRNDIRLVGPAQYPFDDTPKYIVEQTFTK